MPVTNSRTGRTVEAFKQALVDNLYYTRGQAAYGAALHDAHVALAYTARDHLIERWRKTVDSHFEANPKVVYYLWGQGSHWLPHGQTHHQADQLDS